MLMLLSVVCGVASARPMQQICHMEATNRSFIGSLQVSMHTDVEQCKRECLSTTLSLCSSVIYVSSKSMCLLVSGQENGQSESTDQNTMHFRKSCSGRAKLHATLLRKACFEEFRGKVLLGVVDELYGKVSQVQCQKACAVSLLRNSVLCKAAIYYPKEQECIVASQNRFDLPELFTEDEGAIYLENRCAPDWSINETLSEDDSKTKVLPKTEDGSDVTTTSEVKSYTDPDPLQKLFGKPEPERTAEHNDMELTPMNIGISNKKTSSPEIFKKSATLHLTLKKPAQEVIKQILREPINDIETSGYGTDFSENLHNSYGTYTESNAPAISPETIDSYGVDPPDDYATNRYKSIRFSGYPKYISVRDRVLRGAAIPSCFKEIYPRRIDFEVWKLKNSLNECLALCLHCGSCLMYGHGCTTAAYNSKEGQCGLSPKSPADFGGAVRRHEASTAFYQKTKCWSGFKQ